MHPTSSAHWCSLVLIGAFNPILPAVFPSPRLPVSPSHWCFQSYGRVFSYSPLQAGTDGTGIFIDDDGTGYVAFASMPPGFDEPGHRAWPGHIAHGFGHIVSIEIMTPDYLQSTRVNVAMPSA